MSEKENAYSFETLQIHAGQENPDPATDARAVPIYLTSSFVFKDAATAAGRFGLTEPGNIYSRLTNPTVSVFEERIAALEGGVGALGVATGSAAITIAVQNIATVGDHIVSSTNLYGGTLNLFEHTLSEQGLSTTFVNPADLDAVEAAIQDNTKLLYAETLGNPNSDVLDIEGWAAIAHKHNLPLVVDDTFSTPYLLRPIEHGADVVVASATKFIGGHGTAMGGVMHRCGQVRLGWQRRQVPRRREAEPELPRRCVHRSRRRGRLYHQGARHAPARPGRNAVPLQRVYPAPRLGNALSARRAPRRERA